MVGGKYHKCFTPYADEASTNSLSDEVLDGSVQKAEIGESSRMFSQAEKPIESTKNGMPFTSPTLFGGKFIKMFGAKRNKVYLPHLVVITVAVVLLMQVCTCKIYDIITYMFGSHLGCSPTY